MGISIGTIMGGLNYAFKEHDIYFNKGIPHEAEADPNPEPLTTPSHA